MNKYRKLFKSHLQNILSDLYGLLEVINDDKIKIRQINEDGISSILLKKLTKLKNQGYTIKAKSLDVNEKKTGIDFDLWIGENDERYIRVLVQAKSFKNKTKVSDSYSIDHEQCEKLINYSKSKHKGFPLYFLYQFINEKDLESKYFSFIDDFKIEYSSVTFTSAYNILNLTKQGKTSFKDIHKNKIENNWLNDSYSLFEEKDKPIGLPLYLLYDLSPSKIKKFLDMISNKNNTLKLLLLLMLNDEHPFDIHEISAQKIEEQYGFNDDKNDVQIKNLIIINDNKKVIRDRKKKLKKIKEIIKANA